MDPRPNILFITLDSVRYDAVSYDLAAADSTPNIAQIANSSAGVGFDKCISHSEWTRSSVASILSGTYPENHMVGMKANRQMPTEIDPIPAKLQMLGYTTACLSENSLIGPELGFTRGFDRAERIEADTRACLRGLLERPRLYANYLRNLHRHSVGFRRGVPHSKNYLTTGLAKSWMREFADQDDPFFFYLHLNGPHRPYYPTNRYLDTFTDELDMNPDAAREFALDVHDNLYRYIAEGCPFTEDEWNALRAMYDGEIAHADHSVGELFDFISEEFEDTIVVITSDHGELFGERDLLAHKIVLDDAVTRVPLVVHGLETLADKSENVVQHVDVMKTMLEHVGADADTVQGYDLSVQSREYAFSQRGPMGYCRDVKMFKELNPDFDASTFHEGFLTAVRSTEMKLLHSDQRTELVRLEDETTDVSDRQPETKAEFRSALSEWRSEHVGSYQEEVINRSDALEEKLNDLGYLA